MARTSIELARYLTIPPKTTSSSTHPGTPDSTFWEFSADDTAQVRHYRNALRCRRSLRPRRVIHKAAPAIIAPVNSELKDLEPIHLKIKLKLHFKKTLKFKVGVEDEPQDVVHPKVIKLRVTGPKLKSIMRVIDPLDSDTCRLRILADLCYEHLLALGDGSSPSEKL